MFAPEVKLGLEEIEKVFSLFVLEMEFYEEVAFHEIGDFIPRFFTYVLEQLILNQRINAFIECEQNCLFLCDDRRVLCVIECLGHDHVILDLLFFLAFVGEGDRANENDCHELHVVVFVVNNGVRLVVLGAD